MTRRPLITLLLAAALLAAGAATAGASLLIGIYNSASPGMTATGNGPVQFSAPGIGTFSCTVTLTGTLPTLLRPEPLGTPVLPIGDVSGWTFTCPAGLLVIGSGTWRMALDRVLLTGTPPLLQSSGFLLTLLAVDIQIIGPGIRCLYRGDLPLLYSSGVMIPLAHSLAVIAGPCTQPLRISGRFLVPNLTLI